MLRPDATVKESRVATWFWRLMMALLITFWIGVGIGVGLMVM